METIRSIMENRVNSTGVSEPIVETVGSNEVLVQVPGATDPSAIESLVGQTGELDFVLLPPAQYGDDTGTLTCPTESNGRLPIPPKGRRSIHRCRPSSRQATRRGRASAPPSIRARARLRGW